MDMQTPIAPTIQVALGAKLKAARRARGMTLTQLSGIVGCSYQQIGKYERGHNPPPVEKLIAISAALGVPLEDLLPSADHDGSHDPTVTFRLTLAAMVRALGELTGTEKIEAVAEAMQTIAAELLSDRVAAPRSPAPPPATRAAAHPTSDSTAPATPSSRPS